MNIVSVCYINKTKAFISLTTLSLSIRTLKHTPFLLMYRCYKDNHGQIKHVQLQSANTYQ